MANPSFLDNNLLIEFFRRPHGHPAPDSLDQYPWGKLIRQARHSNLLSRVAVLLDQRGILEQIPAQPRQHLQNAMLISNANARSAHWEVVDTYQILQKEKIDFIILKGCAYIWQQNQASAGRLFGDTDILVKKSDLKQAERLLVHNGWVTTKLDAYDQQFYRHWMHEIPPLHHIDRHTSLDVHFSIMPSIIKSGFSIDLFWQEAVPSEQHPGLYTLSLRDMILHSATHLFMEGEFENGLRDITDLDALIRQYLDQGESWENLLERAEELDLSAYLYYALQYCHIMIHTPVPANVIMLTSRKSHFGPIHDVVMKGLFLRALTPNHLLAPVPFHEIACWLLFIRSHWLRMPFKILIPHLFRKMLTRR